MPRTTKRVLLPRLLRRLMLWVRMFCLDIEIADKDKILPLIEDNFEFARVVLARADACIEYAKVRAEYTATFLPDRRSVAGL